MLEKLIRKLYYSLFLVTPLLVFSSTSELFEFNKIMFIYLISMVIFFLWSVKSIRQRKVTLSKTRFDIFILLFVLSQVLSAVFSIDRHTSFFGYYGRFNGGLLSLISYVFLYFGFITFFKRNDIEKLLKLSLVSSVLVILWGLPGRFGFDLSCFVFSGELNNSCWTEQFKPAERMFSTIGQPNWLGAYLAVNFFIGLYFYIRRISRRGMHELLSGAYLLVNFIAILFSRSRSALLAVFVGLIFFATLSYLSFKKKHTLLSTGKRFAFLLFLLLSAVVVFKTGIAGIDRYLTISPITLRQAQGDGERRDVRRPKVETIKYQVSNASSKAADATESFDIRKIVWKGAIDLGLRYPLFGSGVETFAYSYYFVRPKEHNLTSEWDYLYNKAHNEFLNYFATTGFIGLGTYMLMIGIVLIAFFSKIKRSREIKNSEAEILTVALVSAYIVILITNFFGFSTTTINLFFYTIPGLFIILHNEKKATHFRYEEQVFKNNKIVLAINSIIIVALSVFLTAYYVADLQYAQANLYSQTEDYQTAASLLQKSLRLHYEHVYHIGKPGQRINTFSIRLHKREKILKKQLRL
ncbi:O-antigen ligase family protein [Candidatus Roizmanbacteria bacterium]|nr:O-antigen ligase family protein [Candidatus Roizmanbacteria bacterium]